MYLIPDPRKLGLGAEFYFVLCLALSPMDPGTEAADFCPVPKGGDCQEPWSPLDENRSICIRLTNRTTSLNIPFRPSSYRLQHPDFI